MRFLIEGRLRPSCGLTPAEYFDLAVREWEMVVGWLASGVALAYGRPVSVPGGTLLVDVGSESDARALAASLPLAPYAKVTVRRSDMPPAPRPARTRAVTPPRAPGVQPGNDGTGCCTRPVVRGRLALTAAAASRRMRGGGELMALHTHYCLECNQVVGESSDDCDLPQDHTVEEVCQSCAQHRRAAADETLSGGPIRSPDEFGVPS